MKSATLVVCLALGPVVIGEAASLRAANASAGKAPTAAKADGAEAEIEKVRSRLMKVTTGLKPMLSALAATEVGTSLRTFCDQAQAALHETVGKKDHASLVRLQNISAKVHSLFQALTARQQTLTLEGEDQQNSLLLGVLMTKQHETMDVQREILKAPDFAALPVVKALLAGKDGKTALFKQAAAYFDAHPHHVAAAAAPVAGKPDMSDIVSALQSRLRHLESRTAHAQSLHANETRHLKDEEEKAMKKGDKASKSKAHRIRSLRKAEDRRFAKMMALQGKDVQSMKEAITAIEHGDIKGLERAQAALTASVAAMQSHNGGFLVLVQESLRDAGMDCPFCVAQCVGKCHNEGKPYVACLTDCADAGK